jgi:Fe-S-cluster-containing dehydrogenase component
MEEISPQKPYKWEMAVDLDRCTGCEACVVACRAENNIRISGEAEAGEGRAINWIRIERYWEDNCPYIARQFNWFDPHWDEPLAEQLNPDVTVRSNGVMEKCTFCVQRIRQGKERAATEGRRVQDGEIAPACVQTCPTSALVFGDRNDSDSRVSALAQSGRGFHLLGELGTRPAITYLKKVD